MVVQAAKKNFSLLYFDSYFAGQSLVTLVSWRRWIKKEEKYSYLQKSSAVSKLVISRWLSSHVLFLSGS